MTRQRDEKVPILHQIWIAIQTMISFLSYTFSSYATLRHFTKDIYNYLTGATNKYGFSSSTTASQVAMKYKDIISHKTIIVTGSSSGCGYAATYSLAKAGCHVIMAAKDIERAEECVHDIRMKIKGAKLTVYQCDLGDLKSIDKFVNKLSKKKDIWDEMTILINNGQIALYPSHSTKDGFEGHFGVNFVGHYYLMRKLLKQFDINAKRKNEYARIVSLASMVDTFVDNCQRPKWNDVAFYHRNENFSEYMAFAYSKLAVILGTHFLSDYCKNEGLKVMVNCCHPGVVLDSGTLDHLLDLEHPVFYGKILLSKFFTKTINQGAATEIFVATCPKIEGMSGEYFEDCKETKSESKYSNDKSLARELEIFINKYFESHGWHI